MNDLTLKVGIAGCGVVGNKRRRWVDQHPNMETVAVCDVRFREDTTMIDGAKYNYNYSSLEESCLNTSHSGIMKDGTHFYNDYKDLLKNQSMDILIVCLFVMLQQVYSQLHH